jgi:hypothetical protein
MSGSIYFVHFCKHTRAVDSQWPRYCSLVLIGASVGQRWSMITFKVQYVQ